MSDLLPESEDCQRCPWCNGEDVEVVDTVKGFYGFRIRCQNLQCRAEGPEAHTRQLAIAAWNTRQAAPVEARGEGERLCEATRLLGAIYDAYEDGTPCYENPEELEGPLGNAIHLDPAINRAIADFLNDAALKPAPVPQGAGTVCPECGSAPPYYCACYPAKGEA